MNTERVAPDPKVLAKRKLWAISVNNKPSQYTAKDIAEALFVIQYLPEGHFDHPIQKAHIAQALQTHLIQQNFKTS